MKKSKHHDQLAWFLGPKAENASIFENLLNATFQDYIHWRKNYFPDDPVLISKQRRSDFEAQHDVLDKSLTDLLARLRRNFPFYSPRYVAHELSDTQMSAMLGYFAGMLYNPNNVTPEAAPVTTELEIEVCSAILEMLGFKAPPPPPPDSADIADYYAKKSREEFGWAHLTSGGTVANIEALWVARQVRYFPLSVKELSIKNDIDINVKLPSGTIKPIRECTAHQLLLLRPNESVYLLSKLFDAYREKHKSEGSRPFSRIGWEIFRDCKQSLRRGVSHLFQQHAPVILVAASRHYSITKAASILGLGQSSIESIRTDEMFRIDVEHLEKVIRRIVGEGRIPLAVIATAGTTEEGSIDPIHEIEKLRSKLHQDDISFWLHIDAAWGGYMRSLFSLEPEDEVEALANMISKATGIAPPVSFGGDGESDILDWHQNFSAYVCTQYSAKGRDSINAISSELNKAADMLAKKNFLNYLRKMEQIGDHIFNVMGKQNSIKYKLTLSARTDWIAKFVSDQVQIDKPITINWPDLSVASAFLAFDRADSVTVDPHKMGYSPYPAGCIAFKNDRIRSFILESAPYITSSKQNSTIHVPPRHVAMREDGERIQVLESFSPYILEGSRPGAVASGLWAALKCTPYTPRSHGRIVRSSLLSARTMYEWIQRWERICNKEKKSTDYRFISLTPKAPDTNIVTFIITPAFSQKYEFDKPIEKTNALSSYVYERFSIQAELGESIHSYSQPFFLSKTKMDQSSYDVETLRPLFERAGFSYDSARQGYLANGLIVLRASVMSPYIYACKEIDGQDYCRMFMGELALAAAEGASETRKSFERTNRRRRS